MQERAGERFDRLDTDGDGIVSREEFLAASGERAETMFQRMGPNEDGIVTRSARERGGWAGIFAAARVPWGAAVCAAWTPISAPNE
jgi:hypothetical protein